MDNFTVFISKELNNDKTDFLMSYLGLKKTQMISVDKNIVKLKKLWGEIWKEDKVKLSDSLFLNVIPNNMPVDCFGFF